MSNVMQFPRRDLAYRYGLLRAAGTDGKTREDLIQDGIRHVECRVESGRCFSEEDLRDMIECKRERARRQLEDLDMMLAGVNP